MFRDEGVGDPVAPDAHDLRGDTRRQEPHGVQREREIGLDVEALVRLTAERAHLVAVDEAESVSTRE